MGSGLRNMADRLAALRGQLKIQSAPSRGTIITGQLPIPVTSSAIRAQRSHPAEATTA
jgi:signal transduction histidine kinase